MSRVVGGNLTLYWGCSAVENIQPRLSAPLPPSFHIDFFFQNEVMNSSTNIAPRRYSASETLMELRTLETEGTDAVLQDRTPSDQFTEAPRQQENHFMSRGGTMIPPKTTQYRSNLFLAFSAFTLSIFAFYYSYEALINTNPVLGKILFSASTTVFIINVLSQGVSFVLKTWFASLFEALRWGFAARTSGVTLTTFLGLSAGTSLLGLCRLVCTYGQHCFWCAQRCLVILFLV